MKHQLHFRLLVLILIAFLCGNTKLKACSCSLADFCNVLENGIDQVVFKGRTIAIDYPNDQYKIVTVEILENFSDQVDISDTIELIGGMNSAGCETYLHAFKPGEIIYAAMNFTSDNIINLDQVPASGSNYWRHAPSYCNLTLLRVEGNRIMGDISDDFSNYPASRFDEKIRGCSLSVQDIEETYCPEFQLASNPYSGDYLRIFDNGSVPALKSLRIFTLSGQLVFELDQDEISEYILLPFIQEKLLIVEVMCGEERIVQKFFKGL